MYFISPQKIMCILCFEIHVVCPILVNIQLELITCVCGLYFKPKKPVDDRRRTRARDGNQNNSNVRSLDFALHSVQASFTMKNCTHYKQ
jgi:hypothetical protein